MVTDIKWFIVTIITQYVQILNHYVVHLKLIECMLIILQLKQNKTKQNNICLLLSMAFKLPEGSPPAYIKKLNTTIFTASHKESTILSKSSTVCCVFKSWKGFYRFLGVSAINVNLQQDKKQYFTRWLKNSSKCKLYKRKILHLPLKKLWLHSYMEAGEKSLLWTLHQTPWSEQAS